MSTAATTTLLSLCLTIFILLRHHYSVCGEMLQFSFSYRTSYDVLLELSCSCVLVPSQLTLSDKSYSFTSSTNSSAMKGLTEVHSQMIKKGTGTCMD